MKIKHAILIKKIYTVARISHYSTKIRTYVARHKIRVKLNLQMLSYSQKSQPADTKNEETY